VLDEDNSPEKASQSSLSSRKYLSSQTKQIINYIADTIDAITDQICIRVPSIPMTIRVYCKALYNQSIK
jgi:hypothetical protein